MISGPPNTRTVSEYTQSMSASVPGLIPIFRSDSQMRLLGYLFPPASSRTVGSDAPMW